MKIKYMFTMISFMHQHTHSLNRGYLSYTAVGIWSVIMMGNLRRKQFLYSSCPSSLKILAVMKRPWCNDVHSPYVHSTHRNYFRAFWR